MKRKKSIFASSEGLKSASCLAERYRSSFEAIKGDCVESIDVSYTLPFIGDFLERYSVQLSFLIGIIMCTLFNIIAWKFELTNNILFMICSTVALTALVGIAYHITDKMLFCKNQLTLFEKLVERYYEVEDTISEVLSDDIRLTKAVMMYRRDLRELIFLIGQDMGHDIKTLLSRNFTVKSLRQVKVAVYADLEKQLIKELDVIKGHSALVSISGDRALFFVDNENFLNIINSNNDQIEKVFSVYGLKAYFVLETF